MYSGEQVTTVGKPTIVWQWTSSYGGGEVMMVLPSMENNNQLMRSGG
jgi:hypothetical protein